MTSWTTNELEKIGTADELQIAPSRQDGTHYKPVIIWAVRVGDDLYVRSVRGREAGWFRHTQIQHKGQITSSGIRKDVTFVDVSNDETLRSELDAVYRTKYRKYSANYVDPIVAPQASAATLKLVPSA